MSPQQSSSKPVDLQRLVEVDKCRTTHPKPHSGLDEPWYVCAWPLCTYLRHFKYFPQYPLRKRQWRYIQTMSTCWMNERLCCFVPCTAPGLNELKKKKKKTDPEDSEMGLAELRTCGFWAMELFSQKYKCIQCCPIYNWKNRQTYKKSKNDKWLMLVRIYKYWINKSWYIHVNKMRGNFPLGNSICVF